MTGRFVVVGMGADGWESLSSTARRSLEAATDVYGSARQLDLLPADLTAVRTPWRSPMSEHLASLAATIGGADVVHVLASGDPMFHGVGASLVRLVGPDRVTVHSSPSSVSLAAARLGWDLASTMVVSLVTAPVETLALNFTDGARLLVLSRDGSTPAQVAELLRSLGFGSSEMTVLGDLGGAAEHVVTGRADVWNDGAPALNVVAVDCVGPAVSRAPGLPDSHFANDGQLTKQPIRALTVSALAPAEGRLLWDVGAGSGSIGIEWLRQLRTGRVVAFESDTDRAAVATANACRHGVGDRYEMRGAAPASLDGAPTPDAVFIGGGMTADVLDAAWSALCVGGRIVANAVTIETERLLVEAAGARGGDLIRVSVERAAPLGRSTAWRPALPIVQWTAVKESGAGLS
ncbi:precorrin-6Y C5,15-methyltransferase (decarboxylating) [Gordonia malaquae]|uniref:Precorrin-6Y C5,15-methyltransferase n=1 Tax=Gordonia malaquae NBRC 108250 TaxID=1223542 RepID=M3V9W7_GORML|nr:bifunctional cobalt-precorrin-7 (C(5))-methyltransferase/cobalt-precorrin-6B (C(15))-methyltransferase [Gordonia malaquae]GAC78313.1 precorrin-6Y C5,15-methyltransferase [Gordonia malaquae NBRC 108250]SED30562.1 precorrin-6Y C5,15-methyltransferase (decarboxylating) [Gordonia malaquae]